MMRIYPAVTHVVGMVRPNGNDDQHCLSGRTVARNDVSTAIGWLVAQ
jgi:hypothetical protein